MKADWTQQVLNLVITGNIHGDKERKLADEDIEVALALLQQAAAESPRLLLEGLLTALQHGVTSMTTICLAVLFSKANDKFFQQENNRALILNILSAFDAYNLLQLVEILKNKSFGRGLGSRPQKMIRNVMESWQIKDLENYIILQPSCVYALLRLIHPRYHGAMAKLIKNIIDS